jgi:hypothetical protein
MFFKHCVKIFWQIAVLPGIDLVLINRLATVTIFHSLLEITDRVTFLTHDKRLIDRVHLSEALFVIFENK